MEEQKEKEEFGKAVEPKIAKEKRTKIKKGRKTKVGKKKAKTAQKKTTIAKAGTQKDKGGTHHEISIIQTKTVDTEVSIGSGGKEQQEEKSPYMLAREVVVVLDVLSTPARQKGKIKRTSMYFKARKSTRIKVGKPQPSSKEPIVIEDSPTK